MLAIRNRGEATIFPRQIDDEEYGEASEEEDA
jgi:hypothetical protein